MKEMVAKMKATQREYSGSYNNEDNSKKQQLR